MERQLKRGAVLRELLRQERLDPLPIRFQLAWLVAFNAGLFDGVDADALPRALAVLCRAVDASPLRLDDARDDWVTLVSGALAHGTEQHDEPAA